MAAPAESRIFAVLTPEWRSVPPGAIDAAYLTLKPGEEQSDYEARVAKALDEARGQAGDTATLTIGNLDGLIRRTPEGYRPLQWLVSALIMWHGTPPSEGKPALACRINACTYAYLKGAKNLDLTLPERRNGDAEGISKTLEDWQAAVIALQEFERSGEPLPQRFEALRPIYLKARPILSRPSARDERRVLTSLLLNGPSTPAQLEGELGMSHHLMVRVIQPFQEAGVIERNTHADAGYRVTGQSLPVALFGLREAAGIEILRALGYGTGE